VKLISWWRFFFIFQTNKIKETKIALITPPRIFDVLVAIESSPLYHHHHQLSEIEKKTNKQNKRKRTKKKIKSSKTKLGLSPFVCLFVTFFTSTFFLVVYFFRVERKELFEKQKRTWGHTIRSNCFVSIVIFLSLSLSLSRSLSCVYRVVCGRVKVNSRV
jgi:hypothetical protein